MKTKLILFLLIFLPTLALAQGIEFKGGQLLTPEMIKKVQGIIDEKNKDSLYPDPILDQKIKELQDANVWKRDSANSQIELISAKDLDMRSRKINNVTDPTADQDVATKKYVDDNDVAAHQSSQAIGSTSGPTTTSTSYVDLEEMTVTMTTGANPVLILFTGSFSNSSITDNLQVIVDIDGTDKAESERVFNQQDVSGYEQQLATSWLETMTAASHTFKIQWKVSGGTGEATTIKRAMQVIEIK